MNRNIYTISVYYNRIVDLLFLARSWLICSLNIFYSSDLSFCEISVNHEINASHAIVDNDYFC
jgi:hypothetical protein